MVDPTNSRDLNRDFGRLEGEVDRQKDDIAEIKADVKTILGYVDQAKGSWKTLTITGATGGAVAAIIMKALPFLGGLPR